MTHMLQKHNMNTAEISDLGATPAVTYAAASQFEQQQSSYASTQILPVFSISSQVYRSSAT